MKRRRTTVDNGMDWATEAIYQMGPCIVTYTQTEETEEDIETELTGARGFAIVHTVDDVFRRVRQACLSQGKILSAPTASYRIDVSNNIYYESSPAADYAFPQLF